MRLWATLALALVLAFSIGVLGEATRDESVIGWIRSVRTSQAHGVPAPTAWCAGATAVLPPESDPVLMRWPYVLVTAESDQEQVEVVWGVHGDLAPASGAVEFWTERAPTVRTAVAQQQLLMWEGWPIPFNTTMHQFRARLANFTTTAGDVAGAEVCYRVIVDGVEIVGGLRFRAPRPRTAAGAPADDAPVKFVAYGDFGVATMDEGLVADALWARLDDADFTAILGDNCYFYGQAHEFHKRTYPYYAGQWASRAVVPVSGNHDYLQNGSPQPYLDNFAVNQASVVPEHRGRYYSYDWAHVHFTVLDTEWTLWDTDRQMNAWLRADLAANQDRPWRVVLLHRAPYVNSGIGDMNVYRELVPVFEEFGVQVVLGGHWHHYARYPTVRADVPTPVADGGILYVVTGGGGYAVSGTGEYVPQDDGTVVFVPGHEQAHHATVTETNGATPSPLVYLAVHHYVAWSFGDCEAHQEVLDVNRLVIDNVTISRC